MDNQQQVVDGLALMRAFFKIALARKTDQASPPIAPR
jgi:hypothetical protein